MFSAITVLLDCMLESLFMLIFNDTFVKNFFGSLGIFFWIIIIIIIISSIYLLILIKNNLV